MTPSSFPAGPFAVFGDTISAAPQHRLDAQGKPIPGTVVQPSLADLRPFDDPEQRAAVAELFRAAPEVLAQRDDLAHRLAEAITFIEHGVGERAGAEDLAALRRMLDRDVLKDLPLRVSYGSGAHRSEASFDLKGAKLAVALAQTSPHNGHMASYAQLVEVVERMAGLMDHMLDDMNPREAIGSPQEQAVKDAYALLKLPYEPRQDDTPHP